MRTILATLAACSLGLISSLASESALVRVYQPLDGLGSGEVIIMPVAGHINFGTSGFPFEIGLVAAKNIPPTDAKEPLDDHNVASVAGIKITIGEDEKER
jgi:hypothetical protein